VAENADFSKRAYIVYTCRRYGAYECVIYHDEVRVQVFGDPYFGEARYHTFRHDLSSAMMSVMFIERMST
jgi:hypothetical protein